MSDTQDTPVYGFCPAGCKYEVVKKDDFIKAAALVRLSSQGSKWYLEIGKQYKIKTKQTNGSYNCSITLSYKDPNSATYNFTIPCEDKYSNYVVFRMIAIEINSALTEMTIIYEINSIRYKEHFSGSSYKFSLTTSNYLFVENAEDVFLYNEDASIIVEAKDGLDGAGINPNILINGDFRVNQRNQSSYTGQIYGFDRWKSENADLTVRGTGNGIELTSVVHAYYLQFIERYWELAGKTVTLSIKTNGTIYHSTVELPSVIAGGSYGNFGIPNGSVYLYKYPNTDAFAFTIAISDNSVINVEWCKLEISNVPTAFIPRLYAEEEALCQRYYMEVVLQACDYGTSNHTMFPIINLPVKMRVVPSLPENLTIYINGNGKYIGTATTYSITSRFANGVYINIYNENIESAYIYGVYGEGFKLDAEIYLNRV